jgi:tetratricopeptide (TPR) repeat protein
MIHYVSIAIVLVSLTFPVRAQDAEAVRLFDEGTAALIDGRFQDALRLFEPVEKSGWASDALYYNIGLAYYRLDELGQAIRYLEKARLLNQENPRTQHSLAVAQRRQVDRFSKLPKPFWKDAQQWLVATLPLGVAFLIGIACWLVFTAGWVAKAVFAVEGEWYRRGRQTALIVGLVLMTYALSSSLWPAFPDRSVVLEERLELREQASEQADSVVEVHEGLIVEVRASATNWQLVEIPNGTRGWVPSTSLGDI